MILLYHSDPLIIPDCVAPGVLRRCGVAIRPILQDAFQNWHLLDRLAPSKLNRSPQEIWFFIASFRTKRNRNKKTLHIVFYTLALCFLNVFKKMKKNQI